MVVKEPSLPPYLVNPIHKLYMPKDIAILLVGDKYLMHYLIVSLSEFKHIKIHVLSYSKNNILKYSRLKTGMSYYPKPENDTEWADQINNEIRAKDIALVLPVDDKSIKRAIKCQDAIGSHKLALIPDEENYNIAVNKWKLYKFMRKHNMSCPNSKKYSEGLIVEKLSYPLIVKPISNTQGGDGVKLFKSAQELKGFLEKFQFKREKIIQDYVDGHNAGCSVLCRNGEIIRYTIQKEILRDRNPYKPLLAVKIQEDKSILKLVKQLMKGLNWTGVAHIDLKLDTASNTYKILEINTRYWGSLYASTLAGINFPYEHILSSLQFKPTEATFREVEYINIKGVAHKSFVNPFYLLRLKLLLKNSQIKYTLRDPLPSGLKYAEIIWNRVKKRMN